MNPDGNTFYGDRPRKPIKKNLLLFPQTIRKNTDALINVFIKVTKINNVNSQCSLRDLV
jgi:hypothetical protein